MVVKRKRGRPKMATAEKQALVGVRFPPAMLDEIDELCAGRLDQPERSAMIRELVAEGIKVVKRRAAR